MKCYGCHQNIISGDRHVYSWMTEKNLTTIYYSHSECYFKKVTLNKPGCVKQHDFRIMPPDEDERFMRENFKCLTQDVDRKTWVR